MKAIFSVCDYYSHSWDSRLRHVWAKSSILSRVRIMCFSLRSNVHFSLEVYPGAPVWTFTPLTSMHEGEILSIFPPVSVFSIPSHPCFSSGIRCCIKPFMDKRKGDMRFIAYTWPLEHTHSNWSQGRHAVSGFNKIPLPGCVYSSPCVAMCFHYLFLYFCNYLCISFAFWSDKINIFWNTEWMYYR